MNRLEITKLIFNELEKAIEKHPVWPKDIIHCASIMVEEAGEALKAANEYVYENGSLNDVFIEFLHTGAMVYRFLLKMTNK